MSQVTLRTGVWYNDHCITLTLPDHWDIQVHSPNTPKALNDADIRGIMANPVDQPALREIAKGKRKPVIVVDDLARPTPAFKIMPYLLEELRQAGLSGRQVRILVATGTHGNQNLAALRNKLGAQAMDACTLIIHDDRNRSELTYLGKTSQNSPLFINRIAAESDLLLGVGGVYPQHTTGFGGGSKLCLGILGRKTITHLHFKHKSVGGTYNTENSFRRELDEIAHMAGLETVYTLHTNAELELVSLMCGNHFKYYSKAARFSRQTYDAPYPDPADVVIANTYPSDVSYTFMRKAMKVIRCAPPHATKITVASNFEGLGDHGLFQQGLSRRIQMYKALYHRISVMEPKAIMHKILKNVFRLRPGEQSDGEQLPAETPLENLVLFRPPGPETVIPPLPGVEIMQNWDMVLKRIEADQARNKNIKVRLYTCASLQCIENGAKKDPHSLQGH